MTTSEEGVLTGSCLCQVVQYRITGSLGSMGNCYCTDCRKAHSAAFATFIGLRNAQLAYEKGEGELQRYAVRPGVIRTFCRRCSSIMTWESSDEPGVIFVAAGTLDTPWERKPEFHIFVSSKPAWYDILDAQPQYEGHRPPGVRQLG